VSLRQWGRFHGWTDEEIEAAEQDEADAALDRLEIQREVSL